MQWESLENGIERMKVASGWLVRERNHHGLTFVPDVGHRWDREIRYDAKCPDCGSQDISSHDFKLVNGFEGVLAMSCLGCGVAWSDLFHYHSSVPYRS